MRIVCKLNCFIKHHGGFDRSIGQAAGEFIIAQNEPTFAAAQLDLARPITASCGSGITASVLLFALHLIGCDHARLYDGSWQEWEADPETPKAQGPQETTPQ